MIIIKANKKRATPMDIGSKKEYEAYTRNMQIKMDKIVQKNMKESYDGFAVNPAINKKLPKFTK